MQWNGLACGHAFHAWPLLLLPLTCYHILQDETDGLFVLGNRYVAAARESIFLLNKLRDKYQTTNAAQFLFLNGLGTLFHG